MQPPLLASSDQRGTPCFGSKGQYAPGEPTLEPTPAGSCPHFEHQAVGGALLPHACIEGHAFVPGPWRNRRALREHFALSPRLLFFRLPLFAVGKKGSC